MYVCRVVLALAGGSPLQISSMSVSANTRWLAWINNIAKTLVVLGAVGVVASGPSCTSSGPRMRYRTGAPSPYTPVDMERANCPHLRSGQQFGTSIDLNYKPHC